jgi:hypothetical protein
MPLDLCASVPAAVLMAPVLRTIGLWAAGYVLLSLFLALFWILLVSIGQSYSRQSQGSRGRVPHRAMILTAGFRRWQADDEEAWRQFACFEERLGVRGPGEETPAAARSERRSMAGSGLERFLPRPGSGRRGGLAGS